MTKPKTKGQKALATAMKAVKKTGAPVRLAPGPGVPCTPPVYWVESADGRRTSHKSVAAARRRLAKLRRWEEVLAAMSPKRKNKHGNNVSYDQDGKWDSDAEKRRWAELKLLQKAGKICFLERQVRIPLHTVGGVIVGFYVADFTYRKCSMDQAMYFSLNRYSPDSPVTYIKDTVIEDVKGHRTEMFKWKQRHLKIEYGIDITIVEVKKIPKKR